MISSIVPRDSLCCMIGSAEFSHYLGISDCPTQTHLKDADLRWPLLILVPLLWPLDLRYWSTDHKLTTANWPQQSDSCCCPVMMAGLSESGLRVFSTSYTSLGVVMSALQAVSHLVSKYHYEIATFARVRRTVSCKNLSSWACTLDFLRKSEACSSSVTLTCTVFIPIRKWLALKLLT